MKDQLGQYYHPDMRDRQTRMYVRKNHGVVEFRMWNANHPEIWEKHGWLPYEVIQQAADLYQGTTSTSLDLYDPAIAKALLKND